jgi:hypothetical protein
VTGPDTRIYEIEPEPGAPERAAIVAALAQVSDESREAAQTPWSRAARKEAVDDDLE